MKAKLALELFGFAVLALIVAALPRFVSDFRARELAIVGMYFIALLGLSILTGYSGQISLGHGAFMAIGGYTTAILSVERGLRASDPGSLDDPHRRRDRRRRRAARRPAGAPPLRSLSRADHLRHRGVVPAVAEEVRPSLRRNDRQDPQPRQAAVRALDHDEQLDVLPHLGHRARPARCGVAAGRK